MAESRRGMHWSLSVIVGLIGQRGSVLKTVDLVVYPPRPLWVACADMESIAKNQMRMIWTENQAALIAGGSEVASVLFQYGLTPEMIHE